jgi:hypothetical protein
MLGAVAATLFVRWLFGEGDHRVNATSPDSMTRSPQFHPLCGERKEKPTGFFFTCTYLIL